MRKIGILGDIGSGKSFFAKQFGCPVFNADKEVINIYKKDYNCFKKLRQKFPGLIKNFPIKKTDIIKVILYKSTNIIELGKIVHPFVNKELKVFIKKNSKKKVKYVVLDIPLLMENNLISKNMILIFLNTKKKDVIKNLKLRPNFNQKIYNIVKKNQLPLSLKKKKCRFNLINDFKKGTIKKYIKMIKKELKND